MTREFSDELLSAYLDGEVTDAERALVERHLAEHPADRELLDELATLRHEVAALPAARVDAGFADRVVEAAIQAKAERDAVVVAGPASRGSSHSSRWTYVVLAAASMAAAVLLVVRPWQGGVETAQNDPHNPAAVIEPVDSSAVQNSGPLIAALGGTAPAEGEAVVLRLRLSSEASLAQTIDAALAAAGIGQRPASELTSGAAEVGAAYRRQVQEKLGSLEGTLSAADALFVEAPLAQIEAVLAALAEQADALAIEAETRLAVAGRGGADSADGVGEGEGGSSTTAASNSANAQPFAQRLNAGMFRLEKRAAASAAAAATGTGIDRTRPIRVLILVEPAQDPKR